MTNQECYSVFSKAIKTKKIVRYENSKSRDDYSVYAIRETPEGYVFFCRIQTFFKSGQNTNSWKTGSLSSYHEFNMIKGATIDSLNLTNDSFLPEMDFKMKLPMLGDEESKWVTIE